MIDTVILTLSKDMYTISNPDLFIPSARWVLEASSSATLGITSKQNPSKKELLCGTYKPRLSITRRITPLSGHKTLLKIELSLPKLLFGNNFDELTRKDFSAVVKKLVTVLASMGVITTADMLAQAPVSTIHYAKNIPLTDGSTPYHYINKIKEANIKLSLDVNQTDYRNDGHSFKWHCNSYEVVFYDKIRDLEKAKTSGKRSLEKDPAFAYGFGGQVAQLHLFEKLHQRKKFEVLRMEVRLNKRAKIKQLLKKLRITSDLTLKSLFRPSIARKVLLDYLGEIESKRPFLLDFKAASDKALLVALRFNNPEIGPRRILQLYGFKKALEIMSCRELRTMFGSYNKRSWYRLMGDANDIKLPATPRPFGVLKEHLVAFRPLRLNAMDFEGGSFYACHASTRNMAG